MIILEKILHPTDFSDNSKLAMKYACSLAERFEAELHLVYVVADPLVSISPPMSGFLPEGYAQDIVESAASQLSSFPEADCVKDLAVVRKVLEGSAFLEIIRYARDKDMGMIVMGTHGYSGLMHLLMGSVAENVVRKAPCPVLTVRPDGHEFVMP